VSRRPDLPPPDRFCAWLDRRAERASRYTDVHKSWCFLIGITLAMSGPLLASVGAIPEWLAVVICVAGVATGTILMARYHPDNRQF
jgi:hypothetical protein